MKAIWKGLKRLRAFWLPWLGVFWMLSCQSQSPDNLSGLDHSPVEMGGYVGVSLGLPFDRGQVRFQNYTVDDGLSMNSVHDILQDHQGYIWIATEDGLNRFDGYTYKVFRADPDDPEGLTSSNIQTLFEDRQGYLWLGGYEGGISRYDPYYDRFQRFSPDVGNSDISLLVVTAIQQDQVGTLWFGTNDGLYQYDPVADTWAYQQADPDKPDGLSSSAIHDLLVDSTNRIWIGSDGGLNLLEYPNQFTHYRSDPDKPHSLRGEIVYEIYQDRKGDIWVGSDGGLNRFDFTSGYL